MQIASAGIGEKMGNLIVRKAEEEDILAIEEIERQCFALPWTYDSLYHDIIENQAAFYIVAEVDKEICGYMGIWKILDEGHITNVAVAPGFRRKHIGSAMLDVMLEVMEQSGIRSFTLEVRVSNLAAQSLYQKKGFKEAGIRKKYYEDNGEDALIMWREQIEE